MLREKYDMIWSWVRACVQDVTAADIVIGRLIGEVTFFLDVNQCRRSRIISWRNKCPAINAADAHWLIIDDWEAYMMHGPGISKARTLGQEVLAKYGSRMLCSYPVSERNWGIYLTKPTAAGVRTRRKACLFHAGGSTRYRPERLRTWISNTRLYWRRRILYFRFVSVISLPSRSSPRQGINR